MQIPQDDVGIAFKFHNFVQVIHYEGYCMCIK
jgi:hypothetical protein